MSRDWRSAHVLVSVLVIIILLSPCLSTIVAAASSCTSNADCTSRGTCISSVCNCDPGFLGELCEYTATPSCFNSGKFCLYHAIGPSPTSASFDASTAKLFVGMESTATTGYAGVIIGASATDGMTNGDTWVLINNGGTVTLKDYWSTGQTVPTIDTTNSLTLIYATVGTSIKGQFYRALTTGDSQDVAITNVSVTLSWAHSNTQSLAYHDINRGKGYINFYSSSGAATTSEPTYSLYVLPYLITIVGVVLTYQFLLLCGKDSDRGYLHDKFSKVVCCCCCPRWLSNKESGVLDTLTVDVRPALLDLSIGETAAVGAYIIGTTATAIVVHNDVGTLKGYSYTLAHMAALHFALSFFPVSRNSIWTYLLGISWERAIKFHRWLGRLSFVLIVVHLVTMVVEKKPTDIGAFLFSFTNTTNGLGNGFGFLAFLSLSLAVLTSVEFIRRHFFALFFWMHRLVYLAMFLVVLHSYKVFLPYMAFPAVLHLVFDRGLRFYRSWFVQFRVRAVESFPGASSVDGTGGCVKLIIEGPKDFTYNAGNYVFLYFKALKSMEHNFVVYNPFSISSASTHALVDQDNIPNSDAATKTLFSVHIQSMGPETFTGQLYALAARGGFEDIEAQQVFVDGPHGTISLNIAHYKTVFLCGGGIGITPLMCVLEHLIAVLDQNFEPTTRKSDEKRQTIYDVKNVHLLWVCKEQTAFTKWFPKVLAKAKAKGITLHLYCTGKVGDRNPILSPVRVNTVVELVKGKPAVAGGMPARGSLKDPEEQPSPFEVTSGRPHIERIFQNIKGDGRATTCVLACGPLSFVSSVEFLAEKNGMHFHRETFLV